MAQWVVLLDDGGVMNDNRLRGPQWQRLVAEFFAPRLGGASEAWAKANRAVIKAMLEPSAWQKRLQSAQNFHYFDRTYQLDWLKDMCTLVGVVAPDDDACYELARQATALIIPQIRSAFPGAVEAAPRQGCGFPGHRRGAGPRAPHLDSDHRRSPAPWLSDQAASASPR